MRIVNNSSNPRVLNYRDGRSFYIGVGQYITRPNSDSTFLSDTAASLALFSTGALSLLNDDGATYSGTALPSAPVPLVRPVPGTSALPTGTPALGTALAARGNQATFGNLLDQGPANNAISAPNLIAVSWLANAAVALNAYRTPIALDGRLYKCTTAGTNGATEPTWNTTIGGTTTSGTAVYTTEKGPYVVDAGGDKLFRSLASAQLGAPGVFQAAPGALLWDMALGQSLIINLRFKYDYAASGQAASSPILSTRELTGTNRGFRIIGTGASFNNVRFQVRDSNGVAILTDDIGTGFARKPLDGTIRNVLFAIDGAQKILYCLIDGIPVTQADMFSGTGLCPNGLSLAALTGSTQGGMLTIGGDPLGTTSFECAYKDLDITVLPGGLPGNLQSVAAYYTRGGSGVLPQSLVAA